MEELSRTSPGTTSAQSSSNRAQRGSGIVEVVFCVGLVSIVCIAATSGLGGSISRVFTKANHAVIGMAGGWEGIPPAPPPGGNSGSGSNGNASSGGNAGGGEGEGW